MSHYPHPKKHLGQHFLKDENIARKIVQSLPDTSANVVEVGPGTGVLSKYLAALPGKSVYFIDTDRELIEGLQDSHPAIANRFLHANFLTFDLAGLFNEPFNIIGNFPYNISSQIFFKVLENRDSVMSVVGMVQKEVAERIASPPGSKKYGILSVLLQAFYRIEYLFTVNEGVFYPPPKVKSGVIRLTRNETANLDCDESMFFRVVKAGFNQRRKTLRNSLREFRIDFDVELKAYETKRPEQLFVEDFVKLARAAR